MTTRQSRAAILGLVMVVSLLARDTSHAGNPVYGAKGAGMGTAFEAVADDPSAISNNPAGLAGVKGTNLYGGATAVFPSTEYSSPSGQVEETEFQVFFPPHLYVSSDFGMEDVVLGLGIYSPFGIGGRKWDDQGLTRYVSVESTIATISVSPTAAWRVLPSLFVGGGVEYMWSFNEAEQRLNQSSFGARDGKLNLEADGGGWGFKLGVLLFPEGEVSLGLVYRSSVEIDQSGTLCLKNIAPALQPCFGGSTFETDVETTVDFPEIISFGIAYRPAPKWTVCLGAEWVGWSSFDTQTLDLAHEVPQGGMADVTTTLDWKDSWIFKAGLEYKLSEKLALRGGYVFNESPVPNHTLSPVSPESHQHGFSLGFGYKMKTVTFDAFYTAAFYEDIRVDNNILSGEYENFAHFIGFSVGKAF